MKFKVSFLIIILSIIAYAPQAHAAVTTRPGSNTGLAGYWSLNENSGTLAHDFSGNRNTGTLNGGPTWVAGKLGKALNFNSGSTQYIDVGNNSSVQLNIGTINAWIKTSDAGSSYRAIVAKEGAYGIFLVDNVLSVYDWQLATAISTSVNLADNKWHHVAFSFNSGVLNGSKIYIDGVLVTTTTYNISNQLTNLKIGENATNSQYFNGSIDEVRIYNRALSAAEVTSLYKTSGLTLKVPTRVGSVAYWPLDDNSSTKIHDFSGFFNNGTLAGASGGLPSWVAGKRARAIHFDGVDDEIDVPQTSSINLTNNATISAWIKPDTLNDADVFQSGLGTIGAMTIWMAGSQGNHIWFGRQQGGNNDWAQSTTQFVPGQWIHVTGVMNAGVEKIYINGVLEGTAVNSGSFTNGSTYLIGSGDDGHFKGTIDDIHIYNRPLSDAEVMNNYKAGQVQINASQNSRMTGGLIGLWSFNGADMSGTTAFDRSGSGNNGMLTNGPTPTIGKLGQALSFDGVDDYVSTASTVNIPVTTISAWVKISANPMSNTQVVGFTNGIGSGTFDKDIYIDTSGNAVFYVYDGGPRYTSTSATTIIPHNQWVLLTATADGSNSYIYINGTQAGSTVAGNTYTGYSGPDFYIAGPSNGFPGKFSGSIDEVRLYNRALSAAEAKQLYLMGK